MKQIKITNTSGIHARPASMLTKKAMEFNSEINFVKNGEPTNAKSIMGILSMGISEGDEITIEAKGNDAEEAMNTLYELLKVINNE